MTPSSNETPAPLPAVVLLDDNLLFSSSLAAGLKKLGYRPVVVDNPRTAFERTESAAPVAILINLASLRWDGAALVAQLKASPALAAVPVAGFTGHMESDRIAAARAAGCDLVVANSAITSDLSGILSRLLR